MINKNIIIGFLLFSCFFNACATPGKPRPYFLQDSYNNRYYASKSGRILKVEQDGTVLDVSNISLRFVKDRPKKYSNETSTGGRIWTLGKVNRKGKNWNMEAYAIIPETGRCKSLLRWHMDKNWKQYGYRHSCWNRLWEIPTAAIIYPAGIIILLGVIVIPVWLPTLLFL